MAIVILVTGIDINISNVCRWCETESNYNPPSVTPPGIPGSCLFTHELFNVPWVTSRCNQTRLDPTAACWQARSPGMAAVPPATKVPISTRVPHTYTQLISLLCLHNLQMSKAKESYINLHKRDNYSWSTVKCVWIQGLHIAVPVGWANDALVSCECIQTVGLALLVLTIHFVCVFCSEQAPYVPIMQRIHKDNMSVTHVVWGGRNSSPRRVECVLHVVHWLSILWYFQVWNSYDHLVLIMTDQAQTRNRFRFACREPRGRGVCRIAWAHFCAPQLWRTHL